TDDTQMAIGVAETLADRGKIDPAVLRLRFASNFDPSRGYGSGARKVLEAMRDGLDSDFVARTDGYGAAAEAMLAQLAAVPPMSLEAFLALPAEGGTSSNTDRVKAISATTGEGVALKNATKFAPGDSGAVGMYLHHNRQVGVLVEVLCGTPAAARHEAVTGLARELAIHIASANPLAVRAEDLPPALVERERRIATEQVEQEGKPEAIRGKIIDGKVRKFVAEQVLLEQGWVKEEKKPVGQLVTEAAKVVGTSVTVSRFVRFQIGEV
ncbi:MAG: translation elongation factor Ts, partial [Gemmatimonadota bacterium]